MNLPQKVQAGLAGAANSGKSNFLAANAKSPAFVVDADGRFEAVAHMMEHPPIYASRKACVQPLELHNDLEKHGFDVASIIFDSASKLYSQHSRVASMRMNAFKNKSEREAAGLNANKASDMVAKADMMKVIGNSPIYGADIYYVWHKNKGLDVKKMLAGQYKDLMTDKDSISDVELDRLAASMNLLLVFTVENGVYKIRVEMARDFGGQKANLGVVITDYPGNYWNNGLVRVLETVYANFSGQEDSLTWAAKKSDLSESQLIDLYNDVKDTAKPKKHREMWIAWVTRIHSIVYGSEKQAVKVAPPAPQEVTPETAVPDKSAQPPIPEEEPPEPPPVNEEGFEVIPLVPVRGEDGHYHFGDESVVNAKDGDKFMKFCMKFGRLPLNSDTLNKTADFGEKVNGEF